MAWGRHNATQRPSVFPRIVDDLRCEWRLIEVVAGLNGCFCEKVKSGRIFFRVLSRRGTTNLVTPIRNVGGGGKGLMTPAGRRRLRARQENPPRSLRPLRRAV